MALTAWPFYSVAVNDTQFHRWAGLLSIARGRSGVRSPTHFAVTPGTGLQVAVAAGEALVSSRCAYDTTSATVNLTTAHATLARHDLIVLRVNVAAKTVAIAVLTGTPSETPAPPTPSSDPAGITELPLAQVTVAAGATVLAGGNITDKRTVLDAPLSIADLADVTQIGKDIARSADAVAVRALLMSSIGQALATAASKIAAREQIGLYKGAGPGSPAADDLRYRDL